MEAYLSHHTAAYLWEIPYLEAVFGADAVERRPGAGAEDVTVSDPRAYFVRQGCHVHLSGMALPRGAVVKRGGQLVASPPLVFLELANELDIHRLILLGLQMCAHPPGRPNDAVTTKQELAAFVKKMNARKARRLTGRPKAEKALKYIEDGSASVMESLAFMMLTLPHAYGGFGLGDARFNHEIVLGADAQRRLGQKRCFADLYFSGAKLAVEYDSFQHHSTPAEQGKDLLRASALERQGIDVIRFGTLQLYEAKAFEEFAYNLAARLGKRVRIRAKNFAAAHAALRALLPSKAAAEAAAGPMTEPADDGPPPEMLL
ncbi:MAG: endonuclease domain-containing protein [Clostridiales Family XIII bacterium]|jgi:very-short-patch-repair endonuclease|nr:endonuclease domain-containing protein [Clostridiales Family XIII bacterium]